MDIERMKKEVEVTDGHILLGKPIELMKYGKKLIIRQVNWFYEWEDFSYNLAVFLMYYNQVIESNTLPSGLDDITDMRDNLRLIISKGGIVSKASNNGAFKALCKLCEFTGAKTRWMKKHFTIDDWIEVFLYVYMYNILGKKKDLKTAFNLLGIVQSNLTQPKQRFSSSSRNALPSRN